MNIYKLGIADDHELFRKGFVSMFVNSNEFQFIIEASSGNELLSKLSSNTPDILFLDPDTALNDGIKTIKAILDRFPQIKILILSTQDNDPYIIQMLEKGVQGYLSKKTNIEEVKKAIRMVRKEGFYHSEHVSKVIHRNINNQNSYNKLNLFDINSISLSAREKEILELICNDLSSAEIAEKLFISVRTVEGHRLHLLKKTNSKTIAGAVAFAFRTKLIE